ncbi:hypothetical protein GALMADRAFT_132491 [Galerina marginata CBS 339.88]|uniref:Uncharacterized protein n=1 Tax=Galerina marginata (strain CBS 339.88) TaxID=685588 RepID=A0A067U363_GALM3|nr:hypothetical protein GALMADRAFT_132491 [Galerina marginata CBS 339.88]
MAAPPDLTTSDFSGTYILNKTLTDTTATDTILQLQGVSWWTRKAISLGTITLYIKHYTSTPESPSPKSKSKSNSVEHIDIDQTITGGIPGTTELRTLDWAARESNDRIFGNVVGQSRRLSKTQLDAEIGDEARFLKEGWTEDSLERGVVQSYVWSDTPKSGTKWIGNQIWGMEVINGERRYVRHLKFTGPNDEDIETRLIYDYRGPLATKIRGV